MENPAKINREHTSDDGFVRLTFIFSSVVGRISRAFLSFFKFRSSSVLF